MRVENTAGFETRNFRGAIRSAGFGGLVVGAAVGMQAIPGSIPGVYSVFFFFYELKSYFFIFFYL